MGGSLQLREVVDVNDTGKIMPIPETDLNVDAAKGKRPNNSKLEGTSDGACLGDVAPWAEPPSPLTSPPPKQSSGITGLDEVPFFSHSHSGNAPESHSCASSAEPHSTRTAKSSFGLSNNSKPSLPRASSPTASSPGARVAKARLALLSQVTGKKRSKSKTQENNGEHPRLRPKMPPLLEVPGAGPYSSPVTLLSLNQRKKGKDKDKERGNDVTDFGGLSLVANSEDVTMKLDLNLDQMEGIVDANVFTSSSPANGTLIDKGSLTVISGENQNGKDSNVVNNANRLNSCTSDANHDLNADHDVQPPHSPTWYPPQSWGVQSPDSDDPEAEEEYYSGSGIGSSSIRYGLEGRSTIGGGRYLVSARPSHSDMANEFTGFAKLGGRAHTGPLHPRLLPKVGSRRGQDSSQLHIRIYRANNTYNVVQCGFNTTVAMLTPILKQKLFFGEEREMHKLYLRERGTECILGQMERPADIVRRHLEQAGYDLNDRLELLGDNGPGFLPKFVYRSQAFGPTELVHGLEDYECIDLSGHSLRTIPVALHQHADQIISLSLSRNPMLDLPLDFVQSSTSLAELRLSQMALEKVPTNILFATSLTHLDLSSNRIRNLDDAYLTGIPGLKSLKVQNNRMEKLPRDLSRLQSLITLNISNNKFHVLPAVVCQLKNLRDLDFSFNAISELPDDLGLLNNLELLIMVGNQITSIPPSASSLVSLKHLDCRRNGIGDLAIIGILPKLEKLFSDHNSLRGIDLRLGPRLITINGSYNEITEMLAVPRSIGHPAPCTIELLDISHAKLSSISPEALSSLRSLRQLNISHNNIKTLPSTIGDLEHLEKLSCANNGLKRLPGGIGKLKSLKELDVQENNLAELPGELWACASLVKLNATSNLIKKWCPPISSPTEHDVDSFSSGRTSSGLHVYPFPDQHKDSTASIINPVNPSPHLPSLAFTLERLYLGENQITADALDFLSIFQKLKVLNLSFNLICHLPPTFFKNFLASPSSSFPSGTQAPDQMHKSSLEELYLSGNKLTILPTEDLSRMTKLSTLFLDGNRLQRLPQELGEVKNLTVIDVGSNLLKYNIYNWEFDWNWNFNKNLKYLNLSGNKQFQINSNVTGPFRHSRLASTAVTCLQERSLGGFTHLKQLRILGLMDVTIGQAINFPKDNEDRHVRTSESTACGMAYGIADTLGRNDHLNVLDLVHEFPHENKAIFAIFGQSHFPKSMPAGISGCKIARFLRDKYIEVFENQTSTLRRDRAEGIPDVLRRSFLKINQNLHDMVFSSRKQMQLTSLGNPLFGPSVNIQEQRNHTFIARGGASGVVLYFQDKTMYVANAGNALAVLSRGGNAKPISRKHDPYDRQEVSRIRAAEGWISPAGLVNNEIDTSRSFGFFHLLPIINARPDIFTWKLSELDEFVIVANQGLWDFVSYQTAVNIARRERGDPMLAAQKLRDFAMSYGTDGSMMIMVISVSDLFKEDRAGSQKVQ